MGDLESARDHANAGHRFLAGGKAAEAVSEYERAIGLVPDQATWQCGLADALHTLGHLERAIVAYERALAIDSSHVPAWWGLGCATLATGDFSAAVSSFERLTAVAPNSGQAEHNLGKALFHLGQIDRALDAFRRAASLIDPPDLPLAMIATIIPGSPAADDRAVLEARRAWAVAGAPGPPTSAPPRHEAATNRRIRIGYISAFFEYPNWMKPVWGLINHHDRDRFEVHLFSDAPRSRIEHGYRDHQSDRFHDISALSNADVCGLVRDQHIDLLVDLNGYSRLARLPLLELRSAPVQVGWFNTFAPSGLACVDYAIGDEHVMPPGEEQPYIERVVRVPGSYLTFEVTYPVPDVAPAPVVSRGHVTFGCLCPQYKITPQVVEAWSRILRAAPRSRLFLKNSVLDSPPNRRFVLDRFAESGITGDRLDLEGRAGHFTFLGRYGEVDIALDTFPYNGGTTTMEALWQGVPVITFAGDRWASRISASLLHNAGLPELVATNLDDYVARAIELANDAGTPARLDEIRRSMRDRLRRSTVCDVQTFARDMEREYIRMWQRAGADS